MSIMRIRRMPSENVLRALRRLSSGTIICVFGCGGDRDRDKRPLMGKIATEGCDVAIITSDNPRTEPPLAIIDQILAGVRSGAMGELDPYRPGTVPDARGFIVEPDRGKAIELAVSMSVAGDTILIAGKGHETYQITAAGTISFDDRVQTRKALAKLAGNRSPVRKQESS